MFTTRSWYALRASTYAMLLAAIPATSMADVTPIAAIQNDPVAYESQTVTVRGQVYIPTDYRTDGLYSGYIQDDSGRGINLWGSSTNHPALQDNGNLVEVTGSVAIFLTTVELANVTTVTLISSGNPPLTPTVLPTGAAANSAWEGTFIQTTGTILAKFSTGGSAPAVNYSVDDGTGLVVIRVLDILGVDFGIGEVITGRGAGSQFNGEYQILVGYTHDVFQPLVAVRPTSWSGVKSLWR